MSSPYGRNRTVLPSDEIRHLRSSPASAEKPGGIGKCPSHTSSFGRPARRTKNSNRTAVKTESVMIMKDTQKSAKRTTATDKKFKGFTDEERAAMKEYVQERKASAGRGARAATADGESAVHATLRTKRPTVPSFLLQCLDCTALFVPE